MPQRRIPALPIEAVSVTSSLLAFFDRPLPLQPPSCPAHAAPGPARYKIVTLHPLRRFDPQQLQTVGQHPADQAAQPQAGTS